MVKPEPVQEMTGRRSHWDGTYTTKADHVSWYQDSRAFAGDDLRSHGRQGRIGHRH